VDRFENYMSYLNRHRSEQNALGLVMDQRVRIRVVDSAGRPVADAPLKLVLPWARVQGRTHCDGYWDFFPRVSGVQGGGEAQVTVDAGNQIVRTRIQIPHGTGTREYLVRLPHQSVGMPKQLDLAFLIDITGSMGDELRYVNREVVSIVHRVRAAVPDVRVRVGGVFYRDRGDDVRLQRLPFTSNAHTFSNSMTRITAGGGGDYPEDMNAGLEMAMRGLDWSRGRAARVLVVIADAPPQSYADAQYRYGDAMRDASARGIRLLPVAASGANRTVEYLFRAMGAFTSTPYVYLTDDSGIGNPHMEADTDRVAVEKFNELLIRMIVSDLRGKGMHEPGAFGPQ
jgi:Mg-chelatase subunit ChlD